MTRAPTARARWPTGSRAADPVIHVLHREEKDGLGRAYLAGFAYALDAGYDFVVEIDADGSHDPAELPGCSRSRSMPTS